jgi:DNA-binding IclR family transcriptional regulator
MLDLLANSRRDEDKPARNRKKIHDTLAEIRKRGFAVWRRSRRFSDELSISVPLMSGDRLLAALTIRFSSKAVPEAEAIKRFVPRLRAVAETIGQEFTAQTERDAESAAAIRSAAAGASGKETVA